jgi:phosphohistidine phosphatase
MEVYFLRHGEAGKRVPIAARDTERGLTAAGRTEIEEVGEGMAELGLKFDVVATSPLKRAKETASIVNKALKRKPPVEEWVELAPEGSRNALYDRLRRLRQGSTAMFVGHEPYLTTAIGEIVGREGVGSPSFRIVLKKGGLAKVSVTGLNPRLTGELRWLLTPKQIRKMA